MINKTQTKILKSLLANTLHLSSLPRWHAIRFPLSLNSNRTMNALKPLLDAGLVCLVTHDQDLTDALVIVAYHLHRFEDRGYKKLEV